METKTSFGKHRFALRAREPIVSDIFYPADGAELASLTQSLLDKAGEPTEKCRAIMSPHGSFVYSGKTAAAAWKAAERLAPELVVILSPAHRSFEPGIFLPESSVFNIPTGSVRVDSKLVRELGHSSTRVAIDDIPHMEEHAIEVQLPFLFHLFPKAKLVPVLICETEDKAIDRFLEHLSSLLGSRRSSSLFVITSNMCVSEHENDCESATRKFLDMVTRGEWSKIKDLIRPPSFCGAQILSAFLRSDFGSGLHPKILDMQTSAPNAEESEPIVGYAAIAFTE